MTSSWTLEAVEGLAPDASSLKSAFALARVREWQRLECADGLLWGEIQGSGKDPYQARIDLSEPAFKCNCPSRKFPCKHGLALLLLYAGDQSAFKRETPPGWVSEWLSSREQRAEKKAAKAQEAPAVDPAAQAKRIEAREAKVAQGLNELDVWLTDVLRVGLSKARQQLDFGVSVVARLIDGQASGLARELERFIAQCASGEGWEQRALDSLGRISLLAHAYRVQQHLSPELREDVRAWIGWTQSQDEALRGKQVQDRWCVLGHSVEHEARISTRRTWLYGEQTRHEVLVLTFAAGAQPLPPALPCGHAFDGTIAFFPGALMQRGLIVSQNEIHAMRAIPEALSIRAGLTNYAHALASAPWTARWPLRLADVQLHIGGTGRMFVVDPSKHALPLAKQFAHAWHWLAVSGGAPVRVFGEWDGHDFVPLSLEVDGGIFEFMRDERPRLIPMTAYASA